DDRVDFRLLIKELASTFKIRVEMKQVGLRQEAARLGGIGSCGRELCCSTWLTDFRSVNTSSARYQQLSLNQQKLAGQCGKLKCCLNYELDSYLDALKDFPRNDVQLKTTKGIAVFQKMDIFKGHIWYAYKDNPIHWFKLRVDQVNEIIELNKENKKVESLEVYTSELNFENDNEESFANVVGQDSLNRFDNKKQKKGKRRYRNKRKSTRKNA
ncbi:MAG: regulatory iron-sulfur-containing complex subunit RicT, partial [Flavobacteriaceae bacterium]|nr:regulatory iron-sulfur-containing complex subunit RicT [Flavobacteriaceae bacterium]